MFHAVEDITVPGAGLIPVDIDPGHMFRHASEVDPRKRKSKGGYLTGKIKLPKEDHMKITLSTYPAEESIFKNPSQLIEDHDGIYFHPCLLYLIRKKGGRLQYDKMPVPFVQHYKIELLIKDKKVYVMNKKSEHDEPKNREVSKIEDIEELFTLEDNILKLGESDKTLNLQILIPKTQDRSMKQDDVTVEKLLENRQLNPDLKKYFTAKDKERLRLHVICEVPDNEGDWKRHSWGLSQDIIHTKSKSFGDMEIYDVVPKNFCSKGGVKGCLVSKHALCKNVSIQIWDLEGSVNDELVIEQIMVADNVIFFKSPEIPNKYIARKYKLRLKRKGEIDKRTGQSDDTYSNAIDFNVRVHDSILLTSPEDVTVQECLYCSIEDKSSLIPVEVAKPGEKKRGTPRDNKRKIGDFDVERDVKNRRLSGGSSINGMSPDSGRGPSPPIFPDVRGSLMDVYEENSEQVTDVDFDSLLSMETTSDDVSQPVSHVVVPNYDPQSIEVQNYTSQALSQVYAPQVEALDNVPQADIQNFVLQSVEAQNYIPPYAEVQGYELQSAEAQTLVPQSVGAQTLVPQSARAQTLVPDDVTQQVSQAEVPDYVTHSTVKQVNCVQQAQVLNSYLLSGETQNYVPQDKEQVYFQQAEVQGDISRNGAQAYDLDAEVQGYIPQANIQGCIPVAQVQNYSLHSVQVEDNGPQWEAQGPQVQIQELSPQQDNDEMLQEVGADENLLFQLLELDGLPSDILSDGHKPGARKVDGSIEDGMVKSDEGVPWWHKFMTFFLLLLLSITGVYPEEKDLKTLIKKTGGVYSFVPAVMLSVIFLMCIFESYNVLPLQNAHMFSMVVIAVVTSVAFRRWIYRPVD